MNVVLYKKKPVGENNLHLLHDGNKDFKIYSPGKIIYIPRATASGIMIFPGGIILISLSDWF